MTIDNLVAEHTQRALINITSGELGITVDEINEKLGAYLRYATTWKAIVLIDEADVFIGTRSAGASLEHNGLVAGLLPKAHPRSRRLPLGLTSLQYSSVTSNTSTA